MRATRHLDLRAELDAHELLGEPHPEARAALRQRAQLLKQRRLAKGKSFVNSIYGLGPHSRIILQVPGTSRKERHTFISMKTVAKRV